MGHPMSKDYTTKLRDPRWQDKRKEILDRDGHECVDCKIHLERYPEDTEKFAGRILDVHHKYYESGNDPWEYPNEAFITLCRNCHEEETRVLKEVQPSLIQVLRRGGVRAGTIMYLTSMLSVLRKYPESGDDIIRALAMTVFVDQMRNTMIGLKKIWDHEITVGE
jgi:hypothetical protein